MKSSLTSSVSKKLSHDPSSGMIRRAAPFFTIFTCFT